MQVKYVTSVTPYCSSATFTLLYHHAQSLACGPATTRPPTNGMKACYGGDDVERHTSELEKWSTVLWIFITNGDLRARCTRDPGRSRLLESTMSREILDHFSIPVLVWGPTAGGAGRTAPPRRSNNVTTPRRASIFAGGPGAGPRRFPYLVAPTRTQPHRGSTRPRRATPSGRNRNGGRMGAKAARGVSGYAAAFRAE